MTNGRLAGRVGLVTGAGQGVGAGIAKALVADGASVMLAGRTLSKVEDQAEALARAGGTVTAMACDVTDRDALIAAVDTTAGHFGKLDILVNNAQQVPLGPLHKLDDDAVEAGWQSGPMAVLRAMRAALPHMKAAGGGAIVNLGSSSAFRWDNGGYGAYGAVKEAIRQLTRAAASEWGRYDIRANVILPLGNSPGMAMWSEHNPDEAAAFVKTVPLGRVGDCEDDIGRAVAWLCSDEAGYVTGQSIGLDGGQARLV
ncbi:MAG: SDR family oxidoreductase [Alphaproteobacteria bacterium]